MKSSGTWVVLPPVVLTCCLSHYALAGPPPKTPARAGEVRTFKAPIPRALFSVAFSPDGSRVLAGSDQSLYVWHTKTGKQLLHFGEHALRLAVSPDGSLVATCQVNVGDDMHVVRLWDLKKGRELRSFKGHQFSATCVAFSPDGRLVASGGDRQGNKGGRVRIWDPKTLRQKASFDLKGGVTGVAFSPDGKRIVASVGTDLTVRLWDIKAAKELRRFKGHRDQVTSASISPDGRFVLSSSWDKTLRLWDAGTGKELRRFKGHTGWISSAAFSPDGRWVLSGAYDKTVRLWDAATGKEAHRFDGHQKWVMAVTFSPDGRLAASASCDCTVRLWRVPGSQKSRLATQPATTRRSSSQAQPGRLDPVRIEALLNDLTSPGYTGYKKWGPAAEQLGGLADDEALDHLIRMARSSARVTMAHTRPRDIRYRAVCALGFVRGRTEKVMPVLVAVAADKTFGYPKTVFAALSCQGVRSKAALPFVIEAVRGHGSWGAEHIEWHRIGPAAVPYLRKELKNPKSRGWATCALSTLGRGARPAMRELIPSLDDSNIHTRECAARALGAIGPEAKDAVVPLLRVLKEEKDARAASAAAKALGQIDGGTAPVVSGLIAALAEGKRMDVRRYAARALGAIGPPAIAGLDPLLAALGNQKSMYLRWAAADAIGGLGPKARKALPHLKRTLRDENIHVRCASAFSIWQLTSDATLVLPTLLKDLRSADGRSSDWYRQQAAQTLGAIGPKAAPAVPALVEVLGKIPSDGDLVGQLREAAAVALGRIGPGAKAAAPALRKAQSDPHFLVQRVAVEALEKILVEPQPVAPAAKVDQVRTFKAPRPRTLFSVAFSPDGSRVLAGSDQSLYVWQTKTGKELMRFGEHTLRLAVSPDGRLVATCRGNVGDEKYVVRIWDLEKGRELRTFKGHQFTATCVAFSPDGRFVASSGTRGTRGGNLGGRVRIWDAKTLREAATLDLKGGAVAVAFSPDGKRIVAAAGRDNTVRLWDIKAAKELWRFEAHRVRVTSVSMSPDGRFVLTGGWDMTVRLWDAGTGKELRSFEGHTGRVSSAAFSPDGRWILSGGYDKTVRLWDAATGKEAHRFTGHQQWVMDVTFSPDGRFAASASWDGTVRLWRLPAGQKSGPATQPATRPP